jgi:XTP/dITP diphosphohydrolase
MNVYVATKNAGKLRELRAIFGRYDWTLETYEAYADPEEGVDSYLDNAAAKARALREQLQAVGRNVAVLGDDSGLEVHALGGRPGVVSARYGGPDATWAQRRQLLRDELAASGGERSAAFVCALHFIDEDGVETSVLRRLAGTIAESDRGEAGFSYDPIFLYPPLNLTFGEIEEDRKNAISHRARAAEALVEALCAQVALADSQKGDSTGT